MARELAPAGLRSGPKKVSEFFQSDCISPSGGCYAAQREQAPSPQGYVLSWVLSAMRKHLIASLTEGP